MIIKHVPEDFIVEEIPLKQWDDSGPFAVFRLFKESMNTEQAVQIIARRFNLIPNSIKYSGTKDKHAQTIQYISIPNRTGISGIRLDESNLKLEHVGFCDEPLSLGTLKGNKFVITVREITDKEFLAIKSKDVDKLNSDGFSIPNYFDEQRFSSSNYNTGMTILKKDFKNAVKHVCDNSDEYSDTAKVHLAARPNDYISILNKIPRKILLMYIHAVQSFIFNEALSKILDEQYNNSIKNNNITNNVVVDYSLGKLLFYNNFKDYDLINNIDTLELIGFNTENMNHHIKQSLNNIRLSTRDFIVRAIPDISVEGTVRESFVKVEDLDIRLLDDRAIISFSLPKGSYATIVIKALFN